jgi:hypothetical protein
VHVPSSDSRGLSQASQRPDCERESSRHVWQYGHVSEYMSSTRTTNNKTGRPRSFVVDSTDLGSANHVALLTSRFHKHGASDDQSRDGHCMAAQAVTCGRARPGVSACGCTAAGRRAGAMFIHGLAPIRHYARHAWWWRMADPRDTCSVRVRPRVQKEFSPAGRTGRQGSGEGVVWREEQDIMVGLRSDRSGRSMDNASCRGCGCGNL